MLLELASELENPGFPGWRYQLRHVQALSQALKEWELALLMAARSGVDAASWAEVGAALDMTRQSAWQRWADEVDRPEEPQHRLLKARISALMAELDAEVAQLEMGGLGRQQVEDALGGGFAERLRDLINEHTRRCVLDDYEDLV